MSGILEIPVWALAIAAGVVVWLLVMGPRRSDDSGILAALAEAARDFSGSITTLHGRPAIRGLHDGVEMTLSFPPRRSKGPTQQRIQLRFRVINAPNMRVSGVDTAGDLMARGMLSASSMTDPAVSRRLSYLRAMGASDIVVSEGWATVTLGWSYTPASMTKRALRTPVTEVWGMIMLITGRPPSLPDDDVVVDAAFA